MPARQSTITQFFPKQRNMPQVPTNRRRAAAVADNHRVTKFFRYAAGVRKGQMTEDQAGVRRFMLKQRKVQSFVDRVHADKGYVFVATDNFSDYKVYTAVDRMILTDNGQYKTISVGTEVGEATVDGNSALTHIEVGADFQREGIGSHLIQFIFKCCRQFQVYVDSSVNSRYRLSHEGAALIASCQRRGILGDLQVIPATPPASPGW